MKKIAEIQERLEAATPGLWLWFKSVSEEQTINICAQKREKSVVIAKVRGAGLVDEDYANAAFIANAPDDVKFLLDEVDRLTKKLKKAERSLILGGYTDLGAELWKPPLGEMLYFDAGACRAGNQVNERKESDYE